jgi:four helix bundle protein
MTSKQNTPVPFVAYDLALELVRSLGEPLARIRRFDADEAKQLARSSKSVARNLAEGSGRRGADRGYHFSVALGSLREVQCSLDIAIASGWLRADEPSRALAQRLGGLVYKLARR